jgi:hypothetical protein
MPQMGKNGQFVEKNMRFGYCKHEDEPVFMQNELFVFLMVEIQMFAKR